jgi:hypothetical protein
MELCFSACEGLRKAFFLAVGALLTMKRIGYSYEILNLNFELENWIFYGLVANGELGKRHHSVLLHEA